MSIYEKIEAGHYKTKVPYPSRDVSFSRKERNIKDALRNGVIDQANADAQLEKVRAENDEYKKLMGAYHADETRLREKFKKDLFDYLGIEDNPKRDLLFDKAWEMGHSSGFSEVVTCADDLVDLIT